MIARRWHHMSFEAATQFIAYDPEVVAMWPSVIVPAAHEGRLRLIDRIIAASERLVAEGLKFW